MRKKLRNRLVALACLVAFAAGGVVLYRNWVIQKPFAIILIIGDGLNASTLAATRSYAGGAQERLGLESLPNMALLRNTANDFAVPDAASAATNLASGVPVNRGTLGIGPTGETLMSLLEEARAKGRSVGIVSNASLTSATPAAFYAKTRDCHDYSDIALQLVEKITPDVMLGGGEADLVPDHRGGRRQDGRDLTLELRQRGYDVVRTLIETENTPKWRAPKVAGFFAPGNLAFRDEVDLAAAQPTLADMVRQAIQFLQFNPKGYFLVVDAGLIEMASRQNEAERVMQETLELDKALAAAIEYAGNNALIIATGKMSTGGMQMNGYPFRSDKGVALLGVNPDGIPSITWSTGPAGWRADGQNGTASPGKPSEPAAWHAPVASGVLEDVIAVGTGPGAEALNGFSELGEVHRIIAENL